MTTVSPAASPAKSPLVVLVDGEATTTSLAVADFYGKRHDNVMRDIRELCCLIDPAHPGARFLKLEESVHLVKMGSVAGRAQRYFALNFDAFMLLTMGYEGPKALAIKLAYMAEFNRMRAAAQAPLLAQRDHLQLQLDASAAQVLALQAQNSQYVGQLLQAKDEVIAVQRGKDRQRARVVGMQARMARHEATAAIIDMERCGEPRALIALRTGRNANHIRQVLHKARAAGMLPPLADGAFAANTPAPERAARAAAAVAQQQLDLGASHV